MGTEFTFYDYRVAHRNVIEEWLLAVPAGARAKLQQRLYHLEALDPGDWTRPLVDTLTGECTGLFEVRAALSRIQYRILGCHGPGTRQPTLLHCFAKKGLKVASSECSEALRRRGRVYSDPLNYRSEHVY